MPVAVVRHLLTTEGENLTDEQLDEALKQMEVDGDGKIRCDGKIFTFRLLKMIHKEINPIFSFEN